MSNIANKWKTLRDLLELEKVGFAHHTNEKCVSAREAFIRTCEQEMDNHLRSVEEMRRLFEKVCKDTRNLDTYNEWVRFHNSMAEPK